MLQNLIANFALNDACVVDAWDRTFRVCALAGVLAAVGCSSVSSVDAHAVRGQVQPLRTQVAPGSPAGQRTALLGVLQGIHRDFGTTLTPRQLASRLNAPARSLESMGAWVFEPAGSPFEIDANAMTLDSPIDWVRVTIRAELAIHLDDLTKLFSHEYSFSKNGAEFVAVEFRSTRRMDVAAELRKDRPAYFTSAPVVSVQLCRPGFDPTVARLIPQNH